MNCKRLLIAFVCIFSTLNILAQYTCYVGGNDIEIYAPPTNYSRYPDLYEVRWNIQGGGTNVIMLIGDTRNPVTVRPIGAGTATIICSATYYDKSLSNAAGKTTVIKNYTVTCIDNTSGGSNDGGGGSNGGGTGGGSNNGGGTDSDQTIKDGDYFQDYTAEGQLMLFIAGTFWNEKGCYVVPTIYGGSCVGTANGRVTIPNYAKGMPVRAIQNFAFHNLDGLTELVIPSTVTSVQVDIIYGCKNLTTIICEATTPPQFSSSGNICSTYYNCTLYVPAGCKSLYESAKGWKDFKAIKVIGEKDEIDPTSISVSPSSTTIKVGDTFTPTYTISPSDATTTVTWSSDNSGIASVDKSTGQVTGVKAGTTYINATTSNGKTASCKVTVEEAVVEPTSISVSPYSKTIKVGDTFTPTYTVSPSNATTTVTWSSDDSSIASVNSSTGKVTGVKAGTTYIRAKTSNGKSDYCIVTVEETKVEPTSISVSPYTKTIKVGDTFTPTYTVSPSNATTTVTWSSDDSSIASVNSSTGKVTGVKAGTTYINAKTSNGKTSYCKVTVEAPTPTGIAIDETNFPDENFRNYLLTQSYGKDEVLTDDEIKGIVSLDLNGQSISNLKGIEFLTALSDLSCSYNLLTSLDVSKNVELKKLSCHMNMIKGASMDELISSLPQNTTNEKHEIRIYSLPLGDGSNNVMEIAGTYTGGIYADSPIFQHFMPMADQKIFIGETTTNENKKEPTYYVTFSNETWGSFVFDHVTVSVIEGDATSFELKGEGICLMPKRSPNNMTGSAETDEYPATFTGILVHGNLVAEITVPVIGGTTIYFNPADFDEVLGNVSDAKKKINSYSRDNDGNVCTKSQVAEIKAKGWTPYYYNGTQWMEYEGSDDNPNSIAQPTIESMEEKVSIYNLAGQRVTQPIKGGIYIINGKKVLMK